MALKNLGIQAPLKITALDDGSLVDFYQGENRTWRLSQNPNSGKPGLNISTEVGKGQLFIERESGNVGIGTTEPAEKLEIKGNLKVDGMISGKIDAGAVNSGKLTVKRIPNLDAKKIKTGTLDVERIPTLPANKISGGKIDGNLEIDGEIRAKFFRAGQGNEGSVKEGWYRIAQNTGRVDQNHVNTSDRRTNAEFTLRDHYEGYSSLTFRLGHAFNNIQGMSFTLLNHSRSAKTLFTEVRVLIKSADEPYYLEVYAQRGVGQMVDYSIYDNLQKSGWEPVPWTEVEAIPEGYKAQTFDVDQLFAVGDFEERFSIARGGNVGIGTTRPTAKLEIQGDLKVSKEISAKEIKYTTKPIQIKKYDLGNNSDYKTEYTVKDWVCSIAGFKSGIEDIRKTSTGEDIQVYTYSQGDFWYIKADFPIDHEK